MPRTARKYLWTDTAAYHVINRGHNRETVFGNEEEMGYFLTLLSRYRDRFDAQIYHYCLMSNHFHLLLWLPQPQRLSSFMAGLLRSYVHFYHRRQGFVGHLWQGRFKSPVVQREGYWLSCGRYIERNPQEAGLVVRPWEYRWSSAAVYALGHCDPLVQELNPCYLDLTDKVGDRRKKWQELLLAADPLEQDLRQADHFLGDRTPLNSSPRRSEATSSDTIGIDVRHKGDSDEGSPDRNNRRIRWRAAPHRIALPVGR